MISYKLTVTEVIPSGTELADTTKDLMVAEGEYEFLMSLYESLLEGGCPHRMTLRRTTTTQEQKLLAGVLSNQDNKFHTL